MLKSKNSEQILAQTKKSSYICSIETNTKTEIMKATIYSIEKPTDTRNIKSQKFFAVAKEVRRVIGHYHYIKDREDELMKTIPSILGDGFSIETLPMGSGGVGQIKEMKDGTTRIQFGYGVSKHNYAKCLVVSIRKN